MSARAEIHSRLRGQVAERRVLEHLGLVENVVDKIRHRLPAHVERDDLVSVGRLGLIEASRRYERSRGVPFGAFARQRIHGAILDELRSRDMLGRTARKRVDRGEANHFIVQLDAQLVEASVEAGDAGERTSSDTATLKNTIAALIDVSHHERVYDTGEQVMVVLGAMAKLPRLERRLMLLHGFCGVSLHRIASGYGDRSRVSLGAVYAKARERVKQGVAGG